MDNIPKLPYKDWLINQEKPERDDPNYVSFWLEHIGYCKSGVVLGGVHFSGWLYWHLNFFVIMDDKEDEFGNEYRDPIHPELRDNEWLLEWAFSKAKDLENLPILAFGTRRFAKSVIEASRLAWSAFIWQNSYYVIAGGSSSDVTNITNYFDDFYERRPDCYSDFLIMGEWSRLGKPVVVGFNRTKIKKGDINPISHEFFDLKDKPNDNIFTFSRLATRNLEHGQVKSKEEILAGITPTGLGWDEVGKFLYTKQRAAVKPAIMNKRGKRRFIEIMVGTGGNIELAAAAKEDFLNADKAGFFVFNPDEYREEVKPEHFRYNQESDKKTGLFVPAEMSMAGGDKLRIPIYEYLNRDFTDEEKEELEGVYIHVTDWDTAKEKVEKEIEDEFGISRDRGKKAQMYYPFQPEDCFLHMGSNPFPQEEAQKAFDRIIADTAWEYADFVELDSDYNGNVIVKSSKKEPITEYPFKGGTHDAPVAIFEKPIFDDPRQIKRGTYIAGFDGVKIATSKVTDSTITMYIFKRGIGTSGFQNELVAVVTTRPNVENNAYRQCLLLLKMYNAELLPEQDTNLYKYLKLKKSLHVLAPAKGINMRINQSSKAETNYGLPPTVANKSHGLKLLKEKCWEEIPTGEVDEDGIPIFILGVETIPDPMLLLEIINFGNYDNYDRIVAYYHCLIWDEELRIQNVQGSAEKQGSQEKTVSRLATSNKGRNTKYGRRRVIAGRRRR